MAWPAVLTGQLAALAALARQLDDTQWLPAAEIRVRQHRQLVRLATHAAAYSHAFAARLREAGLTPGALATPEGLARLPVLGRREIQGAGEDFYCKALPAGHEPIRVTFTSGSTGEPVKTRRTAVNQLLWRAMSLRSHDWCGRDLARRTAAIRARQPAPQVQPNWGPPIGLLFETGPLLTIPSSTDIGEQARLLAGFRPETLIIYPNNLAALCRHSRRHGIEIAGLSRILTMGETLPPGLREEVAAWCGARLFDSYSSEELGHIALECPESGLYHVMAETVLVEVLDAAHRPCGPGETGRLVITDLCNFASPLVRYDIADYAEVADPCPCGRGLPALKRILGRARNLVRLPDGRRHWPYLALHRYREVAPVVQHQFVQHAPDLIEMRLVVERPLAAAEEAALAAVIREALGHDFRVRFLYFEREIPPGANGKFEEFLCLLPGDD